MTPLDFTIRWNRTDQTQNPKGWRAHARRVICDTVIEALESGKDGTAIQQLVDDAYPFGMRQYTPYKEWLEERNVALWILGVAEPTKRNRQRLQARHVMTAPTDKRQARLPL